MAKYTGNAMVAFHTQLLEGVGDTLFNAGISTNNWVEADGIILGAAGAGVLDSGLDFQLNRVSEDKARVAGSFTRPLSNFLAMGADITFAFPWVGNRQLTAATPVELDFRPIKAIEALLNGAYFTETLEALGDPSGTHPASVWRPDLSAGGTPNGFSAAIYFNGERAEMLDCRCSLSIDFTAQEIPVCTATITPGNIVAVIAADPGVQNYGVQQSVGAPNVILSEFTWGPHLPAVGGFDTMTLGVDAALEDVPDSNQLTGRVVEPSTMAITATGQIYKDAVDKSFEADQIQVNATPGQSPCSWIVPFDSVTANTPGTSPAKSVGVLMPQPELTSESLGLLGTKAAAPVEMIARHTTANEEIQLSFF